MPANAGIQQRWNPIMPDRVPLLAEHGVAHEWIDNHDGTYTVASHQNVEPFLDRNKALAAANDGYNQARDLRRLASIPNIVLMQWLNEAGSMEILRDPKFLAKKLNDPDYLYLRTAPYRIA
ncbi:MAG TPA: hypothetical protein VN685_11835 [Rhizomicrobium sp.]|nr:hypothetical protein [Rhizomicrobium sp.]